MRRLPTKTGLAVAPLQAFQDFDLAALDLDEGFLPGLSSAGDASDVSAEDDVSFDARGDDPSASVTPRRRILDEDGAPRRQHMPSPENSIPVLGSISASNAIDAMTHKLGPALRLNWTEEDPEDAVQVAQNPRVRRIKVGSHQGDGRAAAAQAEQADSQRRPAKQFVQLLHAGTLLFNRDPDAGVHFWVLHDCISNNPAEVAHFLVTTQGLSKQQIGYFFSGREEINVDVYQAFTDSHAFAGSDFVIALSTFLDPFHLPLEQERGRVIFEGFGKKFSADNPAVFPEPAKCVSLVYAVIKYNQERHGEDEQRQLSRSDFVYAHRGLADTAQLQACYDVITTTALRPRGDHLALAAQVLGAIGDIDLDEWLPPHRYFVKYLELIEVTDDTQPTPKGKKRRSLIIFNDIVFLCKARKKFYDCKQVFTTLSSSAMVLQLPAYRDALCIIDIESNSRFLTLDLPGESSAAVAALLNELHLQQQFECSPCAQTLDRLAGRLSDDVGDGRLTLLLEQRLTLMQAQALEAEVSSVLGVLSVAVYRKERHVVIKYDEEKVGPERIRHYIVELGWRATRTAFKNLGIPTEKDSESDDGDEFSHSSNAQMPSSVSAANAGEGTAEGDSDEDSDEYTDMVNPDTGDPNLYLGLYAQTANSDDSDEYEDGDPSIVAERLGPSPILSDDTGMSVASQQAAEEEDEEVARNRNAYDYLRQVQKENARRDMILQTDDQNDLHTLVCEGNIDSVSRLLANQECNVDAVDEAGMTALMHGAQANSTACVQLLLLRKASVNMMATNGATALHEAAYHCDEVMVQILLDGNANMLARDSGGRIPLHWATDNASTDALSALLQHPRAAAIINTPSTDSMTPVMYAAFNNRSDCIRLLLAHGADLEEKDVEGKTAIHWAVHPEDTKCLDQLLTFGSSFYKDYEGRTVAHRIAELGGLPAIRLLLEVRADAISDLDRNQRSPLIWAAACDNASVLRRLLASASSADVAHRDSSGKTALEYAKSLGHVQCARILTGCSATGAGLATLGEDS